MPKCQHTRNRHNCRKFHYGKDANPQLMYADSFNDLFTDIRGSLPWKSTDGISISKIGDYIRLREPLVSWHRSPTTPVVEAIKNSMLCIDNDNITFEIVVCDDGMAYVFAQYNLILGNRYIAQIDPTTIPKGE